MLTYQCVAQLTINRLTTHQLPHTLSTRKASKHTLSWCICTHTSYKFGDSATGLSAASLRMVVGICICICDRDGRRPSSTTAQFEAPDALGSGKRGCRIRMPNKFQFCPLPLLKTISASPKNVSVPLTNSNSYY